METNTLLSNAVVTLYNYAETKKNVDEFMKKLERDSYKYYELTPPKMTPNYEIIYNGTQSHKTDSVGKYVEEKLDKLKELNEKYELLAEVMKRFTKEEKIYFIGSYFNKLSEVILCEKLNMGNSSLKRIKKSSIIKVALCFNKEVENH